MANAPVFRLRGLPSVSAVLDTAEAGLLVERFGHPATADAIRTVLDQARDALKGGNGPAPSAIDLALGALTFLDAGNRSTLRPLFNLTGTVLHTNLGRALLADVAIDAAAEAMRSAVALEFDLPTGKRGERDDHIRVLLCELTGAEDATVVNNNAAAVLLCLNTLALGREVIVSRGELIEIGGAFRMPDIVTRAGAKMVEVGTTNRTHRRDYGAALNAQTAAILKVHTSNYKIQGFTSEVDATELARMAAKADILLLNDLGSGTLVDLSHYGLQKEPTVREAVAQGADLVTFSGDKLLGGPQAGFIVGKRSRIEAINRNPMKRALRVDKIRLAAIEATLKLYRDPARLTERLPTLRILARPKQEIAEQAARLLPQVAQALGAGYIVSACDCLSQIGSGALPLDAIPSAGLAIRPLDSGGALLEELAATLRRLERPIIGRLANDSLILDLRCLADEEGFLAALVQFPAVRRS